MENRGELLSRKEWTYLAIGFAVGIGWFVYNRGVDFGPYPNTADAVSYAEIGNSFRSVSEALSYSGFRTFGFPFFLFLIKSLVGLFGIEGAESVHNAQTISLLLVHFASTVLFYRTVRTLAGMHGVRLHPIALVLAIAHPGLVAHTSILLTDTFATDLLMLASALILGNTSASSRGLALRGSLAGLILGWALATRPFFIAALGCGVLISFGIAIWSRGLKKFSYFLLPMIAGMALLLTPSMITCQNAHGRICMQNPNFSAPAAANSLQMGLLYFRTYWSVRTRWPESQIVIPADASMSVHWETACSIGSVTGPRQWLSCVFSKPLYLPVYIGKKLIAVFDSFSLHPYASDVTTASVRRYSRFFGALSFVGFFYAIWLLGMAVSRRKLWEALILLFPILSLIFQIPMHVEGRYSFPAVPLSLMCLFWVLPMAYRKGRREFTAAVLAGLIIGGTFLIQTHLWDLDDLTLQQIEGRDLE